RDRVGAERARGERDHGVAGAEPLHASADASDPSGALAPELPPSARTVWTLEGAEREEHVEEVEAGGLDLDLDLTLARCHAAGLAQHKALEHARLVDLEPERAACGR